MRRLMSRVLIGFVLLSTWATIVSTRSANRTRMTIQPPTGQGAVQKAQVVADTFVLASFSFDNALGEPDPQGWITVDRTERGQEPFHIDDFSGVGGVYQPLEGFKSLWCGTTDFPNCATCPGYGNDWVQNFESIAFPSSGDVEVGFLVRYDTEPGYDFVYLQYLSKTGTWQTLDSYDGQGEQFASATVPSDSLSGSVRLRLRFVSDDIWSDADGRWPTNGAVVVDSLIISDASGVIDFQDFETESPGDTATSDGDWIASGSGPFGDFAGLFLGTNVLQEDPVVHNPTNLWGFFKNSPDDYSCGGHPEQAVVPFTRNPGSRSAVDYIHNEIWSPFIDLSQDIDGTPIPSDVGGLIFEYDVYRDLPDDNLVFYYENRRYLVDGKPTSWGPIGPQGSPAKEWRRSSYDLISTRVPGATHIQLALGCIDTCAKNCGIFGSGDCHSHAPLIDNVLLYRTVVAPIIVTNSNDSGPGSLRQAITDANTDPDRDLIQFAIPGSGPHVIHLQSILPVVLQPVIIDATTQPGYSGTPLVVVDGAGPTAIGFRGLRIEASASVVRGLKITDCYEALSVINSSRSIIESNHIVNNWDSGVYINGGTGNVIGATTPEFGNVITDNSTYGVKLVGSQTAYCSILGNAIYNNGDLGIDLQPNFGTTGVTPNDLADSDYLGPNLLQNFPTIEWASSSFLAIGGSLNSNSNEAFTIQFFSNSACDPSGHGEGQTFLGSTVVTTDQDGNVDFAYTTTTSFADGEFITSTATDAAGNTSEFSPCLLVSVATAVEPDVPTVRPALHQAVPNPFNPSTTIRYDVPTRGDHVRIAVYDVEGSLVKTLVDEWQTAGPKKVTWEGKNRSGQRVTSGVYFYQMRTASFSSARKILLLK